MSCRIRSFHHSITTSAVTPAQSTPAGHRLVYGNGSNSTANATGMKRSTWLLVTHYGEKYSLLKTRTSTTSSTTGRVCLPNRNYDCLFYLSVYLKKWLNQTTLHSLDQIKPVFIKAAVSNFLGCRDLDLALVGKRRCKKISEEHLCCTQSVRQINAHLNPIQEFKSSETKCPLGI